jgi:hypothetical protein
VEPEAFLLRRQALRNRSRAICRPIRRAKRRIASFPALPSRGCELLLSGPEISGRTFSISFFIQEASRWHSNPTRSDDKGKAAKVIVRDSATFGCKSESQSGARSAFRGSRQSIPYECICRPAKAGRICNAKTLRALPSARFGVPSAQLRSPALRPRSLQPVPREGTRSACTPGLADGQRFTRNCARGPLL